MKKLSLMVAALGFMAMLFIGCKQNADELNVTLPPSVGEDILKGNVFMKSDSVKYEFKNDGTFVAYYLNTYDDENNCELPEDEWTWYIVGVYKYTYNADEKLLSRKPIKTLVSDDFNSLCSYSEAINFYKKITSSEKEFKKYAKMTDEEFEEYKEEQIPEGKSVKEYFSFARKCSKLYIVPNLFMRACNTVEIKDNNITFGTYLPSVSFKELYNTYEIPYSNKDKVVINNYYIRISSDSFKGYFYSVDDKKIGLHNVNWEDLSNNDIYVDYTYDMDTKELTFKYNDKEHTVTIGTY